MGLRQAVALVAGLMAVTVSSVWMAWGQERPAAGSALALCQVQLSLTQEDLAIVRAQMGNLQTSFDAYRVNVERERLTPSCPEGQRWDWTRHEETRQPVGCVAGITLGETSLPE